MVRHRNPKLGMHDREILNEFHDIYDQCAQVSLEILSPLNLRFDSSVSRSMYPGNGKKWWVTSIQTDSGVLGLVYSFKFRVSECHNWTSPFASAELDIDLNIDENGNILPLQLPFLSERQGGVFNVRGELHTDSDIEHKPSLGDLDFGAAQEQLNELMDTFRGIGLSFNYEEIPPPSERDEE